MKTIKKGTFLLLLLLVFTNVYANDDIDNSMDIILEEYTKSIETVTIDEEETEVEVSDEKTEEKVEVVKIDNSSSNSSTLVELKKINPDSSLEDIKYMQSLFKKLELYSGEIDGNYETFKPSVISFQIKSGAIGPNSIWAGYIGNLTFNKLNEKYPELKTLKESDFLESSVIQQDGFSPLLEKVEEEAQEEDQEEAQVEEINIFYEEKINLIAINPNSSLEDIVLMQRLFKKLNLYYGEIDGKYSSFKGSIISFQIKNNVIYGIESIGAGYIGPLTMKKLKEKFPEILKEENNENKVSTIQQVDFSSLGENNKFELRTISPESSVEDIKYMQEFFKKNNLYFGELDGFYSSFQNAIIEFQIDYDIISGPEIIGAGYVGPLTMKKLKEKFPEYIK